MKSYRYKLKGSLKDIEIPVGWVFVVKFTRAQTGGTDLAGKGVEDIHSGSGARIDCQKMMA